VDNSIPIPFQDTYEIGFSLSAKIKEEIKDFHPISIQHEGRVGESVTTCTGSSYPQNNPRTFMTLSDTGTSNIIYSYEIKWVESGLVCHVSLFPPTTKSNVQSNKKLDYSQHTHTQTHIASFYINHHDGRPRVGQTCHSNPQFPM